jgi:DNA-binding MarR family transcriptional regulator
VKTDWTPLAAAQALYAERRRRERVFDKGLFGEPNWDILLDLFIAGEQGREILLTSACIAACAPPTTARRHIVALERAGLIQRQTSASDRRATIVRLTVDARELILVHLRTIDYLR